MKIIIVGAGKVGYTLSEQLSKENHDVTIIDSEEAALRRASDTLDVMGIKGNGVSIPVLKNAGADTADLLIAATNLDEVNMVCSLTARNMGTKYTIARIRTPEYYANLGDIKQELGLDETSRVLFFSTEGATDKENYRAIVWDGLFAK